MSTYNRYSKFMGNGTMKMVPFITIPQKNTDKYTYYKTNVSRLDLISYQYYGDPNYGWLILQANPDAGSLEFLIEDNTKLRIPYPLESALQSYEDEIDKYDKLYGIN